MARGLVVLAPLLVASVVLFCRAPIPQDPSYHQFADQRTILGVPHFGDVVSNGLFCLVGIFGLRSVWRRKDSAAHVVLFASLALTGIGSTWYHWAPDSERLFWDRLPLTLVFMAFFSIVLGERVDVRLGRRLLLPLLAIGAGSVVYWHVGERAGHGDLRFYALVQFYPMLAIPLILLIYPRRSDPSNRIWIVIGLYGAAKLLELLDKQVFELNGVISGHTLKHLVAAMAAWFILRAFPRAGDYNLRH